MLDKMIDKVHDHCEKLRKDLDPFTVVGYYEDSSQIFCDHVMASNSNDAIKKVCFSREGKVELCEDRIALRNNLVIVEIFRGHLESLNDCSMLSNATDWPGLRKGEAIE